MQSIAQAWLLLSLVGPQQGIVYLGLLGAVQWVPVMVFGLFGGIIVDVWPKRRTVIATQIAAGLLALILGALVYFNVVQVWHVFVLGFLLGLVNIIDMPARQSFVVEMVGPDDVMNGIALNSAVFTAPESWARPSAARSSRWSARPCASSSTTQLRCRGHRPARDAGERIDARCAAGDPTIHRGRSVGLATG